MKKIAILILISVFLISCNLPFTISWNTPEPESQETQVPPAETEVQPTEAPTEVVTEVVQTQPAFEGTEMNIGGIYFVLPQCLASSAEGTLIPAAPYDPNNGPMEYYPEYRSISFVNYPLSGKFFDPVLRVYPVADYIAMDANIGQTVNKLQTIISTQSFDPAQAIPHLPKYNAAEVFRAQTEFVDFQNGQGVRFLAEYGQYYAPVNNHDLHYSFQGLTSDGNYWVSITFPINHAALQESYDSDVVPAGSPAIPLYTSATFDQDMVVYYDTYRNMLNNFADSEYVPTLTCLDQFVQSLQIGD